MAFFLTSDPSAVPQALLHNLKHNRVLHDRNVILTVETLRVPVAAEEERVEYAPIDEHFARLKLRFGFMETPNISRALGHARREGLRFDVMSTSFFLGRRKVILGQRAGVARIFDRFFIALDPLLGRPERILPSATRSHRRAWLSDDGLKRRANLSFAPLQGGAVSL